MADQNFTDIKDLVNKHQAATATPSRESEPLRTSTAETSEYVALPEAETIPEMSAEVAEHVEVKKEEPVLSPDLTAAGVQTPPKAVEPLVPVPGPHLPIPDDAVMKGIKESPTDGFHWLAVLMLRILKKSHYTLQMVHGKVTRVMIKSK